MRALIYTNSDAEYELIRDALIGESCLIDIRRDPLDGHGHYTENYDIIVVALDGARGMNEVNEWTGRFPSSKVIWITDDKEFAGIALQKHIHDFIVRPFDIIRLRDSFRGTMANSSGANSWHIPSSV